MSIFDKKRLTDETFKLDVERMRRGVDRSRPLLRRNAHAFPNNPSGFHRRMAMVAT